MARPSIEDRFAIEDLFVRYTRSLDRFDIAGIEACFTEDCVLVTPNHGTFRGRGSIGEWMAPNLVIRDRGGQFRHVVSNFVIDVDPDGRRARASCYLLDYLTIGGVTELLAPGVYDCELERVDGEWLFARRTVIMDHPYRLPEP